MPAEATQSIPHCILQFLTLQVVLNLIRRGLAHVENCLSVQMMWLDLVTHRAPPLRFSPLPLFLDSALVTAPVIALLFVGHRTTDLSAVWQLCKRRHRRARYGTASPRNLEQSCDEIETAL